MTISMEPSITAPEFDRLRKLAYSHFGLDLRPGKETLVESRLRKRLAQLGCRKFGEYLDHVSKDSTGSELGLMIDALTTNFTSFLREPAHFEFLEKTILPALQKRQEVQLWCAGCATGEEPYSVLFSVCEHAPGKKVKILATDISTKALAVASQGVYAEDKISSLPVSWRARYLQKGDGQWSGHFRVKPSYRAAIEFRRVNLMESFDKLPRVPLIFCRNVMIYFDRPTQSDLVKRFAERLEPGGYLLIGHSEGLFSTQGALEYVRPATYRKPGTLA